MSGSKRRYKTLRRGPLAAVVQGEISEAKRRAASGEAAQATDRLIRQGQHPLQAYQQARQGMRKRRRAS
jgi:uncharacterized protein YqeY